MEPFELKTKALEQFAKKIAMIIDMESVEYLTKYPKAYKGLFSSHTNQDQAIELQNLARNFSQQSKANLQDIFSFLNNVYQILKETPAGMFKNNIEKRNIDIHTAEIISLVKNKGRPEILYGIRYGKEHHGEQFVINYLHEMCATLSIELPSKQHTAKNNK